MVRAAEAAGHFEYDMVVKLRPDLTWNMAQLRATVPLTTWKPAPKGNQVLCENDRVCYWPKNVLPVLRQMATDVKCSACPPLLNGAPSCLCLLDKHLQANNIKFIENKYLKKIDAMPPGVIVRDENAKKFMLRCGTRNAGELARTMKGSLRRCHGLTVEKIQRMRGEEAASFLCI